MTDTNAAKSNEKKSSNPLLFVGIGCLVLLVILGIASSFLFKFFAKQVGVGFLQNVIEKKTGVKTNLSGIEEGKLSFTDEKTGEKIDIGSGKIPDTFPKDFPVYPGAKVTSVLSGSEKGSTNGFWLTLSTPDSLEKVSAYYKSNLVEKGWETTATYAAGDTSTQTVTKGKHSGSLAITRMSDTKETDIVIILGEEKGASATSSNPEPSMFEAEE